MSWRERGVMGVTMIKPDTLPLFEHPFTGEELRDGGIKVAVDHADQKHEDWSDRAYEVLKNYVKSHMGSFLCEHVREYAAHNSDLPEPPTSRAWGGVFLRAARTEKIIRCIGTAKVNNPKAHKANASLWVAI
jgi:hypothetical protein